MANIMQIMQKAQKFKSSMQEMQERVRATDIDGASGGGLVKCVINGGFELKTLKVDPSLINPQEAEVMEDLIVAAVNDARAKAEKMMTDETQKLMKDMGLPPGLDLPF